MEACENGKQQVVLSFSVNPQECSSTEETTTENMINEEMYMEATHSQEPAENSNNAI